MNTHNYDKAESMVSGATATDGGMTEGVTGVEIATTSLTFHPETLASSKSHKTSSVWAYFSHFDLLYHLEMKIYRICLVCHQKGIDKAISVGKDSTPGPLITHLRTHHEEYTDFLNTKQKQLEETPKVTANQKSIIDNFLKLSDTKGNF
jgi:hypothetical protein